MWPEREPRGLCLAAAIALGVASITVQPASAAAPFDIIVGHGYEYQAPSVVKAMLELAKVGRDDVVCDPWCGDGRVPCMAVKDFGAKRGLGMDNDPECIKESKENAAVKGVADRTAFAEGEPVDADLRPASVVVCHMLPTWNLALRPNLFRDLKPGSRVASHAFHMGDWKPDGVAHPKRARNQVIYLWIIPASVGGTWEWTMKGTPCRAALEQEFQFFKGTVTVGGAEPAPITGQSLKGAEIAFSAMVKLDGQDAKATYRGTVEGNTIKGTQDVAGAKQDWAATRKPADVTGTWQVSVLPAATRLGGVLTVEKKESGILAATYALDAERKPLPANLFVWGPCVRFEIPTGGPTVDFKGVLTEGSGKGVLSSEGWATEPAWTARRVR